MSGWLLVRGGRARLPRVAPRALPLAGGGATKTPPPPQTWGVAAIGVTSAILAKPLGDILLKAIKPIVKKTIKKIKEKLGKKVVVESAWQRRKFQRSLKK